MRQQSLSVNYTDITESGNLTRLVAASRVDSQHFADTMESKWHKEENPLLAVRGSDFPSENKE